MKWLLDKGEPNEIIGSEYVIWVSKVNKFINKKQILNDLDLKIRRDKFHGILGPNGAGKTTLIKTAIGAKYYKSGEIYINKFPSGTVQAKKQIAFIPDNAHFFTNISVYQLLKYLVAFNEPDKKALDKKINKALETLDLLEVKNKAIRKLSAGMQKKVLICQGILMNAEILILDEPTANLDPYARQELLTLLKNLKEKSNRTIVILTHDIAEAEPFLDQASIIFEGRNCGEWNKDEGKNLVEFYKEVIDKNEKRNVKWNNMLAN